MYADDDLLAISKLNHFCYCTHQWAIGELKQEWADNYIAAERRRPPILIGG